MTDGIVSVGVDPAVCVNVNGNFGVVCSGHQGMFCTNCRHSTSCTHVVCLNRQIEKEELIPELKDFVDLQALDHKPQHEKPLQAISKHSITFELTSSERDCFMKDYSKRFDIQNNIAHFNSSRYNSLSKLHCSRSMEYTLCTRNNLPCNANELL